MIAVESKDMAKYFRLNSRGILQVQKELKQSDSLTNILEIHFLPEVSLEMGAIENTRNTRREANA